MALRAFDSCTGSSGSIDSPSHGRRLSGASSSRWHRYSLPRRFGSRLCHGSLRTVCAGLPGRIVHLHQLPRQHRIPLEQGHYFKTGGFFDFKEHVATLGLVLLPAYWYFWKNAQNPEYDNARNGVTLVLAVMVWFLFIVGHVLNNTRGFGS